MGLKWAHYLRVMLLVPLDQGTQGNKGRKGISLVLRRNKRNVFGRLLTFSSITSGTSVTPYDDSYVMSRANSR